MDIYGQLCYAHISSSLKCESSGLTVESTDEVMMAEVESLFVPAELNGEHYRAIGGSYDSFEKAIVAMEQHFRNKHGGPGLFRVFKPEDENGIAAIVEAGSTNNDPMSIRTIYKILTQPQSR
jgi:hypothetical protein